MTWSLPWATDSIWPPVALRHRYKVQLGKMLQGEERGGADELVPFVQVGHVQWTGVRQHALPEMWASPQERTVYELAPGDLLACEGGDPGRAAVLDEVEPGTIFQNHVFRVRAVDERPVQYLAYVLRAIHDSGWLEALGNKVTLSGLAKQALVSLLVPDAPVEEQERAVEFLDEEVGRLDALSERLEQLVDLVSARRRRLISRVVTEGLDAGVDRKDAGEHGLRRVPAHWEVKRLKWVTPRISVGIVVTPARYYVEKPGVPALRGLNVRPGRVNDNDLVYLSEQGHALHRKSELHAGDVVVVRTGAAGAAAVVPDWADKANAVDILIIRQDPAIRPKFLEYLINSDFAVDQVARHSVGSLQAHFNVGAMKQLLVALPPPDEQDRLIEYLNPRAAHLEALVDKMQQQLAVYAEKRLALITATVTGRVRQRREPLAV